MCGFALVVLAIGGCNDVYTPPVPAYVLVVEFQGEGNPTPRLEGVEVCETDPENCVVTDASGEATLWLPVGKWVSFTLEKDGYLPYLRADVTDVEELRPSFLFFSHEATKPWWDAIGTPYPQRGTGAVEVAVGFGGATLSLITATSKPFYQVVHNDPSPDLEATTSYGSGGFVEVSPGVHQIEFGGKAEGCIPAQAWPGDDINRISVPVRAGYITWANVTCQVPR